MMVRAMQWAVACLAVLAASAVPAHAGILFTINEYDADHLKFTLSGSFDSDSVGAWGPGYLAVKNDWTHNKGVHTEIFSVTPTVTLNTIQIGGVAPTTYYINENQAYSWMDDVFFTNPSGGPNVAFAAGTTVSGSLTLYAPGAFNPTANIATLELLSGFQSYPVGQGDWARLEARSTYDPAIINPSSSVPVPSPVVALSSLGAIGVVAAIRSRRRNAA